MEGARLVGSDSVLPRRVVGHQRTAGTCALPRSAP